MHGTVFCGGFISRFAALTAGSGRLAVFCGGFIPRLAALGSAVASLALTLAARAEEETVDDPWAMARVHERCLASGAGELFPDPSVPNVVDQGLLPYPTKGYPWGFWTFPSWLKQVDHLGFATWPVTVCVDDETGCTVICPADTNMMYIVDPSLDTPYSPDWIARLRYGEDSPRLDPLDPRLLPSRVVSRWTFVAESNLTAYAAARRAAAYPLSGPATSPLQPPPPVPGIRISGFQAGGGGFGLELAGDDIAAYPHGSFHILFARDLAMKDWKAVKRETPPAVPPGGSAVLAVPEDWVFGGGAPFQPAHGPSCAPVTNTVSSPLNPSVVYTNVSCPCASVAGTPAGFFRIVSDVDTTGFGVPDWWLGLHGIAQNKLWVPPDGSPFTFSEMYANGVNPSDPSSLLDWLSPEGEGVDVPFRIYGDYAAWEMAVKGRGPADWRAYRLSTSVPGTSDSRTLAFRKGNSYRVTMSWVSSQGDDPTWYCWEARVDGRPTIKTYNDYSSSRIPGAAETVFGDGWFADNADGLLTVHTHMNDNGGGNVAGGLEAVIYVPKAEIDVTSPKAGASATPPPFEGGKVHVFNPQKPGNDPDPDRHFVVFYKDVVDSGFEVQDFSIKLKADIAPDIPQGILGAMNPRWTKLSGPDSGALSSTTGVEVNFENPKIGGVYKFAFDLDGYPRTEFCIVLPLAGASVDAIMEADLVRAQTFAGKVVADYSFRERQMFSNGRRWFNDNGAGDYRGRPDNAGNKTVWLYNQVNDFSGMGAVATWKGKPFPLAKMNAFMVSYACNLIGVLEPLQWAAQLIGTSNDAAASVSWSMGQQVAEGLPYEAAVSMLTAFAWDKVEDNGKSQKLWPNLAPADNYGLGIFNKTFRSPGFLDMTTP